MMSLLWFYFVFAERLTMLVWQLHAGDERLLGDAAGRFRALYWTMVFCNFVIPLPILAIKKLRTITAA